MAKDMTGTMLLQQAAEDWAKEHSKLLSPYQAGVFGFIVGYIERSKSEQNLTTIEFVRQFGKAVEENVKYKEEIERLHQLIHGQFKNENKL